jgi:hypothetical protein
MKSNLNRVLILDTICLLFSLYLYAVKELLILKILEFSWVNHQY